MWVGGGVGGWVGGGGSPGVSSSLMKRARRFEIMREEGEGLVSS